MFSKHLVVTFEYVGALLCQIAIQKKQKDFQDEPIGHYVNQEKPSLLLFTKY